MAGIMWRQCVVLLFFLAWQVSSAEELVNIIEPRVARWAPQTDQYLKWATYQWKLFDNDISTYEAIRVGEGIRVRSFKGKLSATKVRITVARHVRDNQVPLWWEFHGGDSYRLQRSPVKNGAFEFNLRVVESKFQIKHRLNGRASRIFGPFLKDVPIAEVELLAPREVLDALWPHGKYPCSRRLEMITPLKGELFSVAKNNVSKKELGQTFSSNVERDLTKRPEAYDGCCARPPPFRYDGSKPVIIGVKFQNSIPAVHEIMVHGYKWYLVQGVDRIVLEAHECEPNCTNDGTSGWVKLGEKKIGRKDLHQAPLKNSRYTVLDSFKLETAGEYKAYRLKFYPARQKRRYGEQERATLPEMMDVTSIFFLGCKA